MDLLKAEALTSVGAYPAALTVLSAVPPGGREWDHLRSRRLTDQFWIYFYLGRYDSAAQLLDVAEKQVRDVVPVDRQALSGITVAKLFLYAKTLDLDAARRAMDELDRTDGIVDHAHLLAAYGYVLDRSAHYEQAAKYYESALAEDGVTPLDEGKYRNNLAGIYYHLGDLDQARKAALQAEAALDRGQDRSGLRLCLNTLGLIYKDSGDLAQAGEQLNRALVIAKDLNEKSSILEVENNLASLAIESHDGGKAEELNGHALDTEGRQDDPEARQYSQIARARILAGRREFPKALAVLDDVSACGFSNPNSHIDAEVEYIDIYRQLVVEKQARAHYRVARALVDRVRSTMTMDENKLAWFDSQNALNQEWVRFLVETRHFEEALEAAESSRARLMLERLGRSNRPAGSVSALKSLARSEGALVSYWLMPEVSYAWVVTAGGIEMCKLPDEHAIAAMVRRYQAFLEEGNDPLNSSNAAGEDLRKAILEPILPLLHGASRIVLVPDAQLNALNFETLPVNGRYWIESVTLTVAPALAIFDANPRRFAKPSILVIGDPVPTAEFPKLPSASREMAGVAGSFATSNVLRGAAATPVAFLQAAGGYGYIHFAAHASAVAEHPLDSAVILSAGRLTARDLLRNPIHAELVTISACRSAGVRSYHGEGMVGLAWVFLQTGAQGVIAGLWDASDDATADLMTGLYRKISQGEQPAPALREAKLAMIHQNARFSTPYYWGAFQYYRGANY